MSDPFQILTNTYARDVTAAAQDCTPPAQTGPQNSIQQYVMSVVGTVTVFVAINGIAAIPGTGTSANGYPILAGQTVVFSVPPGATVSCIASAIGSTLYVTSGKGE